MPPIPPVSVPPVTGDCVTVVKPPDPEAKPQEIPSKIVQASDGKMRMDYGDTSVITDPGKQESILLDHVKKEARVIPMPAGLPPPGAPGAPPAGPPGALKSAKVKDLGKAVIEGHEVEGKEYTLEPPDLPKAAELPPPPPLPKPPEGMAPPPPPPVPPPMPEKLPPLTTEVWTSTKLKLPVLTKSKGGFGEQTCKCKYTEAGEPAAALFQIPPDYKQVVDPPPPKPEDFPAPPDPASYLAAGPPGAK